ncbi:hypothetical protein OTK49_00175 [Vibrio coralliirubri]|uniref:hypothetical protein n=1 Tax=Vibrio coralliirubri TaxID=1516159 RepID=UPI002284E690|nr:hypothetical protein [Vibrio coralliirubri]MCY9860956.1 hypothetical protein [Vibrio coralliirubri]
MIEEVKISARRSTTIQGTRRKASEIDYDCVFERDSDTGLYFGFINSNFNINPPKPIIYKHIRAFNPSKPQESLSSILKEIDNEMLNRGYISRCVIIIYKTEDEILVAKVGGGIFAYAVCPAPVEDLPSAVYQVSARAWEAERDFFCGSGAVLPVIESIESDCWLAIMTNTMKIDIEKGFEGEIEAIISENIEGSVSEAKVHNFTDDVFELIYRGSTVSSVDAYLAFI